MHVLIVDDEPDIRFIIAMSLERWGHTHVEAENAAQAYDICRDTPPDAMLLDVSMPGETGLELLMRLEEDGLVPGPVAVLSAAFPGQLGTVAAERGVLHLPKPFALDELEGLVTELARLGGH